MLTSLASLPLQVWTTVDKHQKAQMTSIIHGKYAHEEAIATVRHACQCTLGKVPARDLRACSLHVPLGQASMCETYLIIKNMAEAQEVASYILQARQLAS